MKQKEIIKHIILHTVLIIGAIIFALPFVWMLATSLKTDLQIEDVSSIYRMLVPNPVQWSNYYKALTYISFLKYLWNTIYVTIMSIIGVIISCSLVAYSFARLRWPGRDATFLVLLSTMMLPAQVTMIPIFLIFTKLGWVNTLKPLWVPAFLGNAFFIFLLRQFFLTIPTDLEDAAKIDGCSYFSIFVRIMLPLIRPAIATVVIFQFMGAWNDFLNPLIYIHDKDLMTLSLGLQSFFNLHGAEWSKLMAASTMMTLPVILLFFFAQKHFIQGITLTGIKG
ncbi:MAG: carbohydrate ABC transporter permease [bacterium]|nr:carbohydrate ABC transporter permease [bacterium]